MSEEEKASLFLTTLIELTRAANEQTALLREILEYIKRNPF